VQAHVAPAGDALGFVQIGAGGVGVAVGAAQPCAGEEATGDFIVVTGSPQAIHGGAGVVLGGRQFGAVAAQQRGIEGGAG